MINELKEMFNQEFFKNMFLVKCDSMKPYLKKGDVAIYEPMQLNRRLGSSVYILRIHDETFVSRVQFMARGGIRLISDNDKGITEEFSKEELKDVVFIGHVIGRIIKDYSLYDS